MCIFSNIDWLRTIECFFAIIFVTTVLYAIVRFLKEAIMALPDQIKKTWSWLKINKLWGAFLISSFMIIVIQAFSKWGLMLIAQWMVQNFGLILISAYVPAIVWMVFIQTNNKKQSFAALFKGVLHVSMFIIALLGWGIWSYFNQATGLKIGHFIPVPEQVSEQKITSQPIPQLGNEKNNTIVSSAEFQDFGSFMGGTLGVFLNFGVLLAMLSTLMYQSKKDESADQQDSFNRHFDIYLASLVQFRSNSYREGKQALKEKLIVEENPLTTTRDYNGVKPPNNFIEQLCNIIPEGENILCYEGEGASQKPIPLGDDRAIKIINNTIAFMNPINRIMRRLLKLQSQFENDLAKENIRLFRAQLTEEELMFLGLNILFHEEGKSEKGLKSFVKDYALLKHLKAPNLRRLIEDNVGRECLYDKEDI